MKTAAKDIAATPNTSIQIWLFIGIPRPKSILQL